MPKTWYSREANLVEENDDDLTAAKKEFNRRIAADKKPYFMRYIYPDLMKKYNTYLTNANKKALRKFGVTVDGLLKEESLTDEQVDFLDYFYKKLPVSDHDCIQNKICKRFEQEFDGYVRRNPPPVEFDYTILKSNTEYTRSQYGQIQSLYHEYMQKVQDFMTDAYYKRVDQDDVVVGKALLLRDFRAECEKVCNNSEQLCDIVLDLCYHSNKSKQFAWDMCGEQIIENLLKRNGRTLSFPIEDEDGEIRFCGKYFKMTDKIA